MLPDHDAIKTSATKIKEDTKKTSATKIKEDTKINTICSVLNDQPGIKVLVVRGSYVRKLLRIYYTIPVTTASAEHSFSALKTY